MKQKKIETLVVGIDFSDYSKLVVREAKQLAKESKLPLIFIHSNEDGQLYKYYAKPDLFHMVDILESKARDIYNLDPSDQIVIRFGRPDKEILAFAKKLENPMIIVGHKSGHTIAKFFLGSVAENLAAASPYPLWIHRGTKVQMPRKILIPSDLSERTKNTVEDIKCLKKTFHSQFEIYHVLPHPTPILNYKLWSVLNKVALKDDNLKIQAFKRKFPNFKTVRARGPVIDTINQRSKSFDLIAITPHSRKYAHNAFEGISSKIVRSGETPVLILP